MVKKRFVAVLTVLVLMVVAIKIPVFAQVSSVQYTGSIKGRESHVYHFSTTSSGTVTITNNKNLTIDQVIYMLKGINPDGTETEYASGDTLPAGNYKFVINGVSSTAVSYDFVISGIPFSGTPDTSLPSLSVSNPTDYEKRLPKGTSTTTVSGSTNGIEGQISPDKASPVPISPGSFSKSISLGLGPNKVQVYSKNNSGNEALIFTNIIYPDTKRLNGANRYEVSANISKELRSINIKYDTVLIARGDLFYDALSAAPLAFQLDAPILLTDTTSLPASIKTEIQTRKPSKAIILGGTASVSTNVENELRSLGIQTIERISGNNRYEVSANIAERVVQNNPEGDTAIVVSGLTFPDGLSATSVAARGEMPLLLTDDNTLPSAIQTFLNNHPKIRNFIIIGGPATVSDTVATALDSYGDVERISGSNRYQVNVNVAEYFQLDPSTYVVTRGDDFPDALSGSVLAAATESPVLLTDPTTLPDPIRWHLEAHKQNLDAFYILGGTLSVSSSVEQELYNMIP